MGDRANIVITEHSVEAASNLRQAMQNALVLYTHWGGHGVPADLRDALEHGKSRWEDEPYLARILVSRMTADAVDETTGYGLSVGHLGDNEHAVFVVDMARQRVILFGGSDEAPPVPGAEWTFREYLAAPIEDIEGVFNDN